ncbi:terpene synthase family protein [Actinokineospora globicatena]|uniref:terpene synthase family protein n=1 Tax=Actinokineospora globicatena TaxID=103729 RepID=UPI0020A35FBB|nr:hypothetical protein [Actinokineospora globicatena]MCP2300574.1 hypothetical protein [Actinokineospora globicatena]GLW81119.1 hypothetical protein Aglo01_56000 [Actinokineospora globicatena]GLW88312.1 hypothetical protein Aglo02_59510 [Actinokineospora globicatena]
MKNSSHPGAGLRYGMTYRLPALPTRSPLALHPEFTATAPRVLAWLRPHLVDYFGESEQDSPITDRYLRQDLHRWGALCMPHTRPDRFFAQQLWMNAAALLDDAFSAPWLREQPARDLLARQLCAAVEAAPGGATPLARLLSDVHALLLPDSGSLRQRLIDVGKTVVIDNANQNTVEEFDDLDAYLGSSRRVNAYGFWILALAEWALGIDLDGLASQDPLVHKACTLAIDHWVLVNDLYSFAKEIEEGEKINAVWVLLGQGAPLQEALDAIAARAVATEERFIATRDRVATGPLRHRDDVARFLVEVGHMISGNLRHARESSRYHGDGRRIDDDLAGNTSAEHRTLHRIGTVHEPLVD